MIVAPCLAFGDAGLWGQWRAVVTGERLLYPPVTGNWSSAGLIASTWRLPVAAVSAGLLALLGVGLAPALVAADRGRRLRAWVDDPYLAASAGVVVLLAASPLAWSHYFVLGLLPALWLLGAADRTSSGAGAASIVLASGLLPQLGARLLGAELSPAWLTSVSWVPLWLGLAREAALAGRR